MTNKILIYIFFVSREKQKSEAKDRKVLEILQVKDAKIEELEQVGVTTENSKFIIFFPGSRSLQILKNFFAIMFIKNIRVFMSSYYYSQVTIVL